MTARFEIPEWMVSSPAAPPPSPPPPPPLVDDHRVEDLVNRFIAGKQEALYDAPDAFYRREAGDAVTGAPAIAGHLQALRDGLFDQARDDGERAALAPRLDLQVDDAMDGIGRHVAAQRTVHHRQILAERQRLIRRAVALEPDNDGKLDGLAEAQASAAKELARLDGMAADSPEEADRMAAARSQILRDAIEHRIAAATPDRAVTLYDRIRDRLSPADREALALSIGNATNDAVTDAWLARETAATDGPPLADRIGPDAGLSDLQRLILRAKIAARDSAEQSHRVATVQGIDDDLAAATATLATQPARYRPGTLSRLADAYADAGATEQADATRRLARQEHIFRTFSRAGAAVQQRHLDDFTGPERALAETIMRQQQAAFAADPYAAGTALYPNVGPPLPEDAEGRLRQVRMIEAMRDPPVEAILTNVNASLTDMAAAELDHDVQIAQAAPLEPSEVLRRNAEELYGDQKMPRVPWESAKEQFEQQRVPRIDFDTAEQEFRRRQPRRGMAPPTEPSPDSKEFRNAWDEARRLELEEAKGSTTEPAAGTPEHEAAAAQVPSIEADEAARTPGEAPFKEPAPNDPAIERAFQRYRGGDVVLPNGEKIPDPDSPTGHVMGPFNDLRSVADAAKAAQKRLILKTATATTIEKIYDEAYAIMKENLGQGGAFDYQRRDYGPGKDGFTQLPQFRNISNVNVGLFCEKLGLPLWMTLMIAGRYAGKNSSNARPDEPYGLHPQTRKYIEIGYQLGESGQFD